MRGLTTIPADNLDFKPKKYYLVNEALFLDITKLVYFP